MTNINDVFVAGLQALVREASRDSAASQGIQTLGEVCHALRAMPADAPIVLDTGGHPGGSTPIAATTSGSPSRRASRRRWGASSKCSRLPMGRPSPDTRAATTAWTPAPTCTWPSTADCGQAVVGAEFADGVAIIQTAEEEW